MFIDFVISNSQKNLHIDCISEFIKINKTFFRVIQTLEKNNFYLISTHLFRLSHSSTAIKINPLKADLTTSAVVRS